MIYEYLTPSIKFLVNPLLIFFIIKDSFLTLKIINKYNNNVPIKPVSDKEFQKIAPLTFMKLPFRSTTF